MATKISMVTRSMRDYGALTLRGIYPYLNFYRWWARIPWRTVRHITLKGIWALDSIREFVMMLGTTFSHYMFGGKISSVSIKVGRAVANSHITLNKGARRITQHKTTKNKNSFKHVSRLF